MPAGTDGSEDRTNTGPARPSRRITAPWRRLGALVLAGLCLGLAAGRFASSSSTPAPAPAPARPERSPAETVARLEQAVSRRPNDAQSWRQLGTASLTLAAYSGDPASYRVAERAFDRADALAPGDPATTVGRGLLALARHEFTQALELGHQTRAADSFDPDALAVVVDAEVELGRYDDAANHLQEMLDQRPAAPALARASYLRELHGDIDGARAALQQAELAASGPAFDRAGLASLRGDLAFSFGDFEEAADAYRRALRLSPRLVGAVVGQARVRAAEGRRPEAVRDLQAVVDRFPQSAAATLLGELLELEGRPTEAAGAYDLVRTVHRLAQEAGAVTDLEAALFEADHGDPGRAVELATRAHAARPTVQAADALAWAQWRAGDAAGALPFVEEALRLGTADPLVRFHAAAVLATAGQAERARSHLAAALSANPWFSFHHRALALELARQLGVDVPAGDRR